MYLLSQNCASHSRGVADTELAAMISPHGRSICRDDILLVKTNDLFIISTHDCCYAPGIIIIIKSQYETVFSIKVVSL